MSPNFITDYFRFFSHAIVLVKIVRNQSIWRNDARGTERVNSHVCENDIYKCKFVCRRKFKYPCEMWGHLQYEPTWSFPLRRHWHYLDKDTSNCGIDDPNEYIGREKIDYELKGSDECLSDAKDWVAAKVKKIITKICCCQEENGLFCDSSHPHYEDDMITKHDWTRCCQKCKSTNFKLPVNSCKFL